MKKFVATFLAFSVVFLGNPVKASANIEGMVDDENTIVQWSKQDSLKHVKDFVMAVPSNLWVLIKGYFPELAYIITWPIDCWRDCKNNEEKCNDSVVKELQMIADDVVDCIQEPVSCFETIKKKAIANYNTYKVFKGYQSLKDDTYSKLFFKSSGAAWNKVVALVKVLLLIKITTKYIALQISNRALKSKNASLEKTVKEVSLQLHEKEGRAVDLQRRLDKLKEEQKKKDNSYSPWNLRKDNT